MAARVARSGHDRVWTHKSGQPLPEGAVREVREIGLMADHGMYDIGERGAARGQLVRAKRSVIWRKTGMSSRLVAEQVNWAKRDDVTQNTPPLVAARHLVSKASSSGHKVGGAGARCLAGWDCSVAFHHAQLDEDIVVIPPKGLCTAGFAWQRRRAMNGDACSSVCRSGCCASVFLQQRNRCGSDRAW